MNFVFVLALLIGLNLVQCTPARIVDGQDTDYTPFVAVVYGYQAYYRSTGGGSFISQRHVLTAANLIYGFDTFAVGYGDLKLGRQFSLGASPVLYRQYDPNTFENDIAILKLHMAIDPGFLKPIALPKYHSRNAPFVYEQGRVSGFGMKHTSEGWIMNEWKQTSLFRRLSYADCRSLLSRNDITWQDDKQFCAWDSDHGSSICHGDQGSGMTVYIDNVETLVGVVSFFTNMCARDYPAVFTRVAAYLYWINWEIENNN